MAEVTKFIAEKGFVPAGRVDEEVRWFYNNLGIVDVFFKANTVRKIAEIIIALFAAKALSWVKHQGKELDVELQQETEHGCIMICNSQPGVSIAHGPEFEKIIDAKVPRLSAVSAT